MCVCLGGGVALQFALEIQFFAAYWSMILCHLKKKKKKREDEEENEK